MCFSTVLETGDSKVQKLPGVVPHESQFSVLQMPVFSSDCILTARAGPGTSHSPILAQRGETEIALAGIGQGAVGRQTDDTRQLHPLDLI